VSKVLRKIELCVWQERLLIGLPYLEANVVNNCSKSGSEKSWGKETDVIGTKSDSPSKSIEGSALRILVPESLHCGLNLGASRLRTRCSLPPELH